MLSRSLCTVALPFVIVEISGSIATAGVVNSVGTFAYLAVMLFGGVLIDRIDRRMGMYARSISGAVLWLAFGLLLTFNLLKFWQILVIIVAVKVLDGLFGMADNAALRSIIPDDKEFTKAIAINQGRNAVIEITGGPIGGRQGAADLGRGFSKLVMFTSLSKRSNVPGLRSGFVAGDAALLKDFLLYRTYHGSAMGIPVQMASIAAWNDETHVLENRRLYQEKFARMLPILAQGFEVTRPDASFYIWLQAPDGDDLAFARTLWREAAIQVLPGRFLARDTAQGNPGAGYVRIALVAPVADCVAAAEKIVAIRRRCYP